MQILIFDGSIHLSVSGFISYTRPLEFDEDAVLEAEASHTISS